MGEHVCDECKHYDERKMWCRLLDDEMSYNEPACEDFQEEDDE